MVDSLLILGFSPEGGLWAVLVCLPLAEVFFCIEESLHTLSGSDSLPDMK